MMHLGGSSGRGGRERSWGERVRGRGCGCRQREAVGSRGLIWRACSWLRRPETLPKCRQDKAWAAHHPASVSRVEVLGKTEEKLLGALQRSSSGLRGTARNRQESGRREQR
jgi:hypothetical protein